MKTKLMLRNLSALSLIIAATAFAEEESTPELTDSDREAVTVAVLQHYFANKSGFTKKVGLVAFVEVVPKAGDKPQAASDSIKKHFGNRPLVQDVAKYEGGKGNVIIPETGQSSVIITVSPIKTVADNLVSVRLQAYGGDKSSTNYEYQLKKVDGGWEVASVRTASIS